ncbi:zinc-dependent peptidase [Fulvivirga ligni]|uniref:M90 family metallopeptidase n=1 Tax=Fulvivirga ligni TaxID=2904246 RepID=UPI001F490037|nr:M90 family metallopeptidase [Fulvivirga ligni]UII21676.1 zinc-dependent peptidase [Fulvivirga ligni]
MKKKFKPDTFDYFISISLFIGASIFSYPLYSEDPSMLMMVLPVCALISYLVFKHMTKEVAIKNKKLKEEFPEAWKAILEDKVKFYRNLSADDKEQFEQEANLFISSKKITGISTEIDDTDRLLVASSAIIPVFAFPNWNYDDLSEVLIYPNSFNHEFETEGEGRNVLGMVGNGVLNGKMILSKKDLHYGFEYPQSKSNVGIHEFVHLIDDSDGSIDGLPALLMEHSYAKPWMEAIKREIDKIRKNKSDINPYGGTSEEEFFPVLSEYFFQRPRLLKRKHPELYKMMNKVFRQDPVSRIKRKMSLKKK